MPDAQSLRATTLPAPDDMAAQAVQAALAGADALAARLETLPVPIYVTDADGWITYCNSACADFAGRVPVPGEDRWCVTWRLYTESGAFLPHDQCPMAEALRTAQPVRGAIAVAERPDGTRVMFTPYPTPILAEDGRLAGAVNILIDVTDARQAHSLHAQAVRCRRLAQSVTDARTVETLMLMAEEYEGKAQALSAERQVA